MILADRLAAKGSKVFGWDIEWEMDWRFSRLKYGGEEMLRRLSGLSGQAGGQTVILCHDVAFRPGAPDRQHLTAFLREATQAGYQFRTINTFREE